MSALEAFLEAGGRLMYLGGNGFWMVTGVHEELGAFALPVNPFDIQEQADAIHRALTMPLPERRARREQCEAVVRENDLDKWLARQLADIAALSRPAPS